MVKPNFPPRNGWARGDKARLSMAKADAKADLNFLAPLTGVIPYKKSTNSQKIDSRTLQTRRIDGVISKHVIRQNSGSNLAPGSM